MIFQATREERGRAALRAQGFQGVKHQDKNEKRRIAGEDPQLAKIAACWARRDGFNVSIRGRRSAPWCRTGIFHKHPEASDA